HLRVPLDGFAGARVRRVELAAVDVRAGEIGFRADDIRLVRAQGQPIAIFRDALPDSATIVRDEARGAGVAIVPASASVPALRARVFGAEGEVRTVEIERPSKSALGFVPRRGDGYAGESFALVEVPLAAEFGIRGIELFDDPTVRIFAATLLWRRDGPSDSHF